MQQRVSSATEHESVSDDLEQRPSSKEGKLGIQQFLSWPRAEQLETFLAWLPSELADIAGIDWTNLSPEAMRYCLRTVGNSPDAAALAITAASLHELPVGSQYEYLKQVKLLLQRLRSTLQMQCLADLQQEQSWLAWAAQQKKTNTTRGLLAKYITVTTNYIPRYLRRLHDADRQRVQPFVPPPPPAGFAEDFLPYRQLTMAQHRERKAATDILVPLYPVLRQLVRLRKQLAERMVLAFRDACRKVEAGEVTLPYHFHYADAIPEMNQDAQTVAEVTMYGREVAMKWVLWDKRTWVMHHAELYHRMSVADAEQGRASYQAERNCLFLEFEGPACDLLWVGDIVEHRLLQKFTTWDTSCSPEPASYQQRWQFARRIGFTDGCACDPAGLLNPGDRWFPPAAERSQALIVEPESLYRGVLFGSALAMLALSNGSRLNELLQVSCEKERRVTRTETVILQGEDGRAQMGDDGRPLTKEVKLYFQHLLPKGAKTEEERQLFPLSREVMRLLGEIKKLLEETHGEIPVVSPSRSNQKFRDLKPERYLFQWNAWPGERQTSISAQDVQTLIRFILYGLDLYTAQGKPIRITVHVLRHVMATHARQYRHVPPEVIAHYFLHHRLRELTGRTPSLADVSEYYTQMTAEQRSEVTRADLDEQEEQDHALLHMAPTIWDLERKNEDIQAVYEIWHALHPTALGNCGCPGLCPRGTDRSLCLGCRYLVEDPEKLGAALAWQSSYVRQAELLEAQGNAIDARQARIKVQLLDDIINVMRLQLEEEVAGHYIPVFRVLPSPYRKREVKDEKETSSSQDGDEFD